MIRNILSIPFFIILLTGAVYAGPYLDVELGPVFTGYNDVRITNRYGTRFSLTGVLESRPAFATRIQAGYTIKDRHTINLLAAPLEITAGGRTIRDIIFRGRLYPAGYPLKAVWRFNSYRLTYRYDVVHNDSFKLGFGLTGKIRDAAISLETLGIRTQKYNLGFVPLVNFRMEWFFHDKVGFLLEGDALGTTIGRAIDFLGAFQFRVHDTLTLKLGYRLLEGGADSKSIYNFSLHHYAVAGVTVSIKDPPTGVSSER